MSVVSTYKQEKYTGENRCQLCTIVNIGIAVLISISMVFISGLLSIAIFSISLVIIYFRGYLVPGTPQLTKRYVPDQVLRWFDKEVPASRYGVGEPVDVENWLLHQGILRPTDNGNDITLSSEFQSQWSRYLESSSDKPGRERLREVLNIQPEDGIFSAIGETLLFSKNGTAMAQWPSPVAVKTDVATAEVCSEWVSDWEGFSAGQRADFLQSIRAVNDVCPVCDGVVAIQEEVVESCCSSNDILVVACQDCNARMLEMEAPK